MASIGLIAIARIPLNVFYVQPCPEPFSPRAMNGGIANALSRERGALGLCPSILVLPSTKAKTTLNRDKGYRKVADMERGFKKVFLSLVFRFPFVPRRASAGRTD
jgi:hypothetical protein